MAVCRSANTTALTGALLIVTHLLIAAHYNIIVLDQWFPAANAQQLQATMPLGSSWPAGNLSYLLSPAKTFSFGWLQFPAASGSFYVAVWYAALDNAVVWVANRDTPAAAGDTLQLTPDGNLLIVGAQGQSSSPIWQTDTSSKGVYTLQVNDSGNIVLLGRNNASAFSSSAIYWQSFSSPTDTLLPTQSFLNNQTLISRPPAFSTSLGSGNFMFHILKGRASIDTIDAYGNSIATVWQSWPALFMRVNATYSSGTAGHFMETGVFFLFDSNGTAYSQLVPSDYGVASNGTAVYRRLTLDPEGDLRMYGWDYATDKWIVLVETIGSALCSTMALYAHVALCGQYGVCVNAPTICACPPGFHPTDRGDVSRGCSPDNNLPLPSCSQNANNVSTSYAVMHNTDYVWNDFNGAGQSGIALAECQNMCTEKCSCVGFIYNQAGPATCWLKTKLMYGYSPQLQGGTRDAFVKVYNSTASSSTCPPAISNNSNSSVVLTASVISACELLCFLLALFLLQKTMSRGYHHRLQLSALMEHPGCQAFTFAELVQATQNFRQPLGSGGFGEVFKGVLPDGREIAVKRLKTSALQASDTHDQFRAEVATLGRIHHMNLVRLYGYCADQDSHRLLVYEFMKNGAMNEFMFEEEAQRVMTRKKKLLDWKTRYNVCLGMARGLAYLHEDCLDCIVHCDIKPENILLDNDFCPKVADFGLAYLFGRNETLETSTVRGTRGYLAPEWLSYLPITGKADVFSYGMLLIEIVSGRKNFRYSSVTDDGTAIMVNPSWAFRQLQSGRVEEVVDPGIRTQVDYGEVEKVLRIAFLCLHQEARARPSMRSIVLMLEGAIQVPAVLPHGSGSFQHQVETGFDPWVHADGQVGPRLITTFTSSTTTNPSSSSSLISAR